MTTCATVPVTVTPEAEARIAQRGLQAEVDRMIDHARHHLPDLERIEVELYDRYDLGDEPVLVIECYGRRPFDPADQPDQAMVRWAVTAFPPEVLAHLIFDYHPGAPDVG